MTARERAGVRIFSGPLSPVGERVRVRGKT
jgi:hypothetical protein